MEEIQDEAIKCKHCGEILDAEIRRQRRQNAQVDTSWNPGVAALLSLFIPGAGQIYKGNVGGGIMWLIFTVIGYIFLIVPGLVIHLFCIINASRRE